MPDVNEEWAAQRRRIVAEVRAGRVPAAEVAATLGVTSEAVRRWVRREDARSRFVRVAVRPEPSAAALEVVLGEEIRVRVPADFDAAQVVRLVRELRRC